MYKDIFNMFKSELKLRNYKLIDVGIGCQGKQYIYQNKNFYRDCNTVIVLTCDFLLVILYDNQNKFDDENIIYQDTMGYDVVGELLQYTIISEVVDIIEDTIQEEGDYYFNREIYSE